MSPEVKELLAEHVLVSGSLDRAIAELRDAPFEALHLPGGVRLDPREAARVLESWRPPKLPQEPMVTVFHGTSRRAARVLLRDGFIPELKLPNLAMLRYEAGEQAEFAPGRGVSRGLYVGDRATAGGFGPVLLELRVPRSFLSIPPEQLGKARNVEDALRSEDGAVILRPVPPTAIQEATEMKRNPKIVSLSPPMEAAAGVSVTPNRPSLDDVRSALLSAPKFTESLGLTLAALGADQWDGLEARVVGHGHYAYAFAIGNGMVLKVTDDPDDAQAAETVRLANVKGVYPAGLPVVMRVKEFKVRAQTNETEDAPSGLTNPMYAIVYEAVVPVSKSLNGGQRAMLRKVAPVMAHRKFARVADIFELSEAEPGAVEVLAAAEYMLAHDPRLVTIIEDAMKGAAWFREHGFEIMDIHAGNIGLASGGRYVLFDFGHDSNMSGWQDLEMAENPLPIDNKDGIGTTGYNRNIDFLGLRVMMRPSTFLKLSLPLVEDRENIQALVEQIRSIERTGLTQPYSPGKDFTWEPRKGFGSPMLYLEIPSEWENGDFSKPAMVRGHEGRHRMHASREVYGDEPVETHLKPQDPWRASDFTPGRIERLKRGLISERHRRGRGDGSMRETPAPFEVVGSAERPVKRVWENPRPVDVKRIWEQLGRPDVDMNELRMGIETEREHGGDDLHAGRTALDHLAEFPDYYTRLTKMEERAKKGLPPNPRVQPPETRDEAFRRLRAENQRAAAALKRIDSKIHGTTKSILDALAETTTKDDFTRVASEYQTRMANITPQNAARRERIFREWEDSISEKIDLMGRRGLEPNVKRNPRKKLDWGGLEIGEPLNLGDVVYHGTRTDDDSECPCFDERAEPMWVSDATGGSDFYSYGYGGIPWRLTFEVYSRQPPRLIMLRDFAELDELAARIGQKSKNYDDPELDRQRDAPLFDPRSLAPLICKAGYDGWHIENGEGGGSDTMLCEPAQFLRLVKTERLDELKSSERMWGVMDDSDEGIEPNGRKLSRARRAFNECFDVIEERFPDFGDIELHEDEKAGSDNGNGSERQFGYCMDGDPIVIAFAAKIEKLPEENIRGLMAHEFGHALDYRYGKKLGSMLGVRLPDGVERRADAIAKAVFGRTIKYDEKLIQCVGCKGTAPRPRKLGP